MRAAPKAAPFRPFTVHMADGRSFPVARQELFFLSPSGKTAIVYQEDDEFDLLDPLLVTEIEMGQASKPRA